MDAWRDIRLKASECHRQALSKSKGDRKADALIGRRSELEDLQLDALCTGLGRQQGRLRIPRPRVEDDQRRQRPKSGKRGRRHRARTRSFQTPPRSAQRGDRLRARPGRRSDRFRRRAAWKATRRANARKSRPTCSPANFCARPIGCATELLAHGRRPADIATDLGLPPGLVDESDDPRALASTPGSAAAEPDPTPSLRARRQPA